MEEYATKTDSKPERERVNKGERDDKWVWAATRERAGKSTSQSKWSDTKQQQTNNTRFGGKPKSGSKTKADTTRIKTME